MVDVIVIGAGPAGSATAALLRKFGYDVQVWERTHFPRPRIGESLPPRTVALLQHLGFVVSGFAVMEGHTSVWGQREPHRAVFEEGYGLQVERDRFDQMLVEQSGVPVFFGRAATGIIREDGRVAGATFKGGALKARFVIDASGPGKKARFLRQSAIYGYWKNSRHPEGSQASDTIIESFADGWVWSLRLSSDQRNVTVLFDRPEMSTSRAVTDRPHSKTAYEAAIARTSFVKGLLDGAELVAKPIGCDASWQCAEVFAEPGLLLVGDAGSVIDPLSSQGVYKGLTSAMAAAIVVNTCLKKPEREPHALRFYNEEERRTYDGYSAGSVAAFRAEQRWPERSFWKKRHELSLWDIPPTPFSMETALAIESGRAEGLKLRNAPGVRVEARPAIAGAFIELEDCVITPRFQYGYRGRHGAAIMSLHKSLASPRLVREIVAGARAGDSGSVLRLLSYMYKEGLVELA